MEFDYLKGLFLIAIFFIHAFQVAGAGRGAQEAAYKVIYIVCMMSGAAIFIFAMGLGSRYGKGSVLDMLRSGGRLFGYQYLNNTAFFAAAVLPCLVLRFFMDTTQAWGIVRQYIEIYLFYINIFFIAGGIYFILAFLRRVKAPIWLYGLLGLGVNIVSPKLVGLGTGYALIDYVLGGLFGGTPYASFSILNYTPYALLGVCFGEALRRAACKKRFYLIACSVSAVIIAAFCVWKLRAYPDLDSLYKYISLTYINPDFARTIASTATVIFLAGLLYFLSGAIVKCGPVYKQLLYYSKHISKHYAVHTTFFLLVWGFNSYESFGFAGCFVLFVLCIGYTEAVVRAYNWYVERRRAVQENR